MSVMTISGSLKGFNTIKVLVMFAICYVSFIIIVFNYFPWFFF